MTKYIRLVYVGLVAAGLVGCGQGSLPAPVERLPGKWQGQMIVFEDAVAGKLSPEQARQHEIETAKAF